MKNKGLSIAVILNSFKINSIDSDNVSTEDKLIAEKINKLLKSKSLPESEKICPECKKNFKKLVINKLELDFCPDCTSLWFDTGELSKITGLSKEFYSEDLKSRKSKLKCPVCEKEMEEHVFYRKDNLLIDVCGTHGIYLQSGELGRVIEIKEKNLL